MPKWGLSRPARPARITGNPRRYVLTATWTLLAAPPDDGSVRLFDVGTGEPLPPLERGWQVGTFAYTYADRVPPAYFAFSSDGRALVYLARVYEPARL